MSFGKRKESVPAVRGLDLLVRKGDSFALLGLNGQGKSTTVRTILGLSKPDSGTIQLFGIPLTWTEKDTALRHRIGYLSENVPFPPYLTVDEVLRYHARLMGYKGKSASLPQIAKRTSHPVNIRVRIYPQPFRSING